MRKRDREILHKEYIEKLTTRDKANATACFQGRCFVIESKENKGIRIGDNPKGNPDYEVEPIKGRKDGYYPTCYPQAAAAAASWEDEVSYEIGRAMGQECRKQEMNVLLRPGVNIKRSPLCGRNFEYYAEDPLLSGKLGAAFIKGVQSAKTAACLKHYAVNSQEFERMTTNAVVSDRALRELYLKPFEIAIKESDPWTMMTSYNKVNGEWVPANEKLMKILREDFGYDGVVMSDAMAVHTKKVESHRWGLDFEIGARGVHTRELQDAVDSGVLEEGILDQSMDRLLTLQEKTAFEGDGAELSDYKSYEEQHIVARRLAAKGIVLLENKGILPILQGQNASSVQAGKQEECCAKKVAVIGKLSKEPNYMGCGSGHMNGYQVDITLEEMQKLQDLQLLQKEEILYCDGYEVRTSPAEPVKIREDLIKEAVETAKKAAVVLVFTGLPTGYETEGVDRRDLKLPEDMRALLKALLEEDLGERMVLVNVSGGPVELSEYHNRVGAIVHSYPAGEAMGGALADVLYGKAEPEGRLPETFPVRLEDTPSYLSFPNYPTVMENVYYGEDIFVGYRWYEKRKMQVLYPFGHGLSYTSFALKNVKAEVSEDEKMLTVTLTVENTGKRAGSQVVQVYVGKEDSRFMNPVKELKGYGKVFLQPGEEKQLTISIETKDLAHYEETRKKWIRESGAWQVYVGTSAEAIAEKKEITLHGGEGAKVYNYLTALEWYCKNENLPKIIENLPKEAKDAILPKGNVKELLGAVPVYRLAEDVIFGTGHISKEELSKVIDELNQLERE